AVRLSVLTTDLCRGCAPTSASIYAFYCFFFQAEDGIRDDLVTGVQTCALPISCRAPGAGAPGALHGAALPDRGGERDDAVRRARSEERRVGKGWRSAAGRRGETREARRW